jgi:hypothetical protein
MLEFVFVLVAKMRSPVTNGGDYLRHFFSTYSLMDIYELAFFGWDELLPFAG